jgi:hypothetical protein
MSSRALKCCAIFNRMFEKVGGRINSLSRLLWPRWNILWPFYAEIYWGFTHFCSCHFILLKLVRVFRSSVSSQPSTHWTAVSALCQQGQIRFSSHTAAAGSLQCGSPSQCSLEWDITHTYGHHKQRTGRRRVAEMTSYFPSYSVSFR